MNAKHSDLARHKLYALIALISAAILLIIAHYFHNEWLKAFSEAALVGGLADWFAVVALFRHPMGLAIPHTALIPKNKDRIGESLGLFVAEEFLTRERLEPKINEFDFVQKFSHWLAQEENARKLANHIAIDVIPGIFNVVNDEDVKHFLHEQFKTKLESINFGEWLGAGLDTLTKDGRHQELLTAILEKLHDEFQNYEDHIHTRVSEQTPGWTFGLADKSIANGIIHGIDAFLEEAKYPKSDVRKKVDAYIVDYITKLKTSKKMQTKINSMVYDLSHNQEVKEYIYSIWSEMKMWIDEDLSKNETSKIKTNLTTMFQHLGDGLEQDVALRSKINTWLQTVVVHKLIEYKSAISHFIASTVVSWDSKEVSEKLELEIGKDLQFIRLNGTLVGGLIGIVLFFVSKIMG